MAVAQRDFATCDFAHFRLRTEGSWCVTGYQMERPMKTQQIECGAFDTRIRRLRSLLSAQVSRRIAASLGLLLIATVVIAATTVERHASVSLGYGGGNLMLLPGQPGLAPALY